MEWSEANAKGKNWQNRGNCVPAHGIATSGIPAAAWCLSPCSEICLYCKSLNQMGKKILLRLAKRALSLQGFTPDIWGETLLLNQPWQSRGGGEELHFKWKKWNTKHPINKRREELDYYSDQSNPKYALLHQSFASLLAAWIWLCLCRN